MGRGSQEAEFTQPLFEKYAPQSTHACNKMVRQTKERRLGSTREQISCSKPVPSVHFSCAKRGAFPGKNGEPGGPGGGRRHLLLLLHQGKPAGLQDHVVAQRASELHSTSKRVLLGCVNSSLARTRDHLFERLCTQMPFEHNQRTSLAWLIGLHSLSLRDLGNALKLGC